MGMAWAGLWVALVQLNKVASVRGFRSSSVHAAAMQFGPGLSSILYDSRDVSREEGYPILLRYLCKLAVGSTESCYDLCIIRATMIC